MLPNRWAKRLKTQESVQRSLCRLAFIVLGVFPTVGVLAKWGWSILPWSKHWTTQAWERSVGLGLGVHVRFGEVENPTPNSFRFRDVILKHSETGELIATIACLEYRRGPSSWQLRVHSPAIQLSEAGRLAQAIHQRYLCQPHLSFPLANFSLRGLTFVDEAYATEPLFAESRFVCHKNKSSLEIRLDRKPISSQQVNALKEDDVRPSVTSDDEAVETSPPPEDIHFALARHHDLAAPRTECLLRARGFELPVKVVEAFYAAASQLGPEATFQGDVRWIQNEDRWSAELAGLLRRVQWASAELAMDPTLTHLTAIRIDRLQVFDGRMNQAQGLVWSEAGWQSDLGGWLAAINGTSAKVQAASHVNTANEPPLSPPDRR